MLLTLPDSVQPAPALASWVEVSRLVEDASWQIYHLPADGLLQILPQLNQAIQEIGSAKP
jgi:hypothetical protein